MKTVACACCNRHLDKLDDLSSGALTFGGSMPAIYSGVVCEKCGKIECTDCKGDPADRPCSWCGGSVSPAFEHLLR